jgi:hypothetical protein
MRIKLLLILYVFFCTTVITAQYKNIQVNSKSNNPNETTIAINPTDVLNIIAAANINNYYYTYDGGLTWKEGTLLSADYGVWGDPCLVFDSKGNAYYFHLANPKSGQWIDRIICQKSLFGGQLWENPGTFMGLNPPKKQDKEWACVDLTGGKFHDYIYVTWTEFDKYYFGVTPDPKDSSRIMFSRSTDAGESWSSALRLNKISGDCKDSSLTTEGAVPCVGPDGEIYVSWSGPAGIVFDKSYDAGYTWLEDDIFVVNQVGGWEYSIDDIYRCNGMPVSGCDISKSQYKGNIYISYSDRTNGEDDVDIFLVKSSDGGNTWSNPLRVNDDPLHNKKQQFMSWMSVDPVTGTVNIIFLDRRNHNDSKTDVYLARSVDGGATFENIIISEKPFRPVKSVFYGDYINVSSYNDFVACIWQRIDDGKISIQFCGADFRNKQ